MAQVPELVPFFEGLAEIGNVVESAVEVNFEEVGGRRWWRVGAGRLGWMEANSPAIEELGEGASGAGRPGHQGLYRQSPADPVC